MDAPHPRGFPEETGLVGGPTGPEPRRLVRLITRLNIGGPARQALLLSRALAEDFPTVLAAGTPPPEEGELADPDVPVTRVPLVRPLRPATDMRAFVAVRRLLTEARPRLVHTHMAKAGTIGRSAAWTIRPRPRLIHTFHGHVLEGYFNPAVQRSFIEIERRLARRSDALIAVSTEIKDSLLELGIGSDAAIRVIPLGFDLQPFVDAAAGNGLRDELHLPPDAALIGTVGRLVPIKDHLTLLEAMARLADAHLVVVGDGELRSDLERQARELRVADRVHFTGWRRDIPQVIAELDVVALTSRNERTPVSLIEAHAGAKAAVATDVGGVRSVVLHEETGLIVPPGDAGAVASALERLLADPGRARGMGAAGRRHVTARFGQERLIEDIRALYRELLSRM